MNIVKIFISLYQFFERPLFSGEQMKISVYISLFIILFISPFLPADTVTQTWTASYNSPMNLDDILADIAVDNSGNVYVTGTSLVGSTSNIVTIKYNSAGVQQWVRSYDSGLSANDYAAAIAADGSGNVYVAGRSDTATSGLTACTTLKYNSSGTLQWAKSFQGTASTGTNQLSDILVEPSGNVYVVGSAAQNTTNSDYVIIKYSPAGDEVWNKTYNSSGSESDYAISMVRDSAGGLKTYERAMVTSIQ